MWVYTLVEAVGLGTSRLIILHIIFITNVLVFLLNLKVGDASA